MASLTITPNLHTLPIATPAPHPKKQSSPHVSISLAGCDAVCDKYAAYACRLICAEGGATADFAAQCLHTNVSSFRDGGEVEQWLQGGQTGKRGVHRWQWLAFLLHDFEHRGGSGFDFLHGFFWSLAEGEAVSQGRHAGDVTFVIGAVGDSDLVGNDFHFVWSLISRR